MLISDWSSDVCSSDLTVMKALAAADDTFMSSTTDLMKDMLFGGTSNLSRHTEMTQPLLEDLCFLPGENTERSEEHTSELQSLMRISYAVFCLKKKKIQILNTKHLIKQP